MIPQFHLQAYWLAYWDKFGKPDTTPKYGIGFTAWWIDAAKDRATRESQKK